MFYEKSSFLYISHDTFIVKYVYRAIFIDIQSYITWLYTDKYDYDLSYDIVITQCD